MTHDATAVPTSSKTGKRMITQPLTLIAGFCFFLTQSLCATLLLPAHIGALRGGGGGACCHSGNGGGSRQCC